MAPNLRPFVAANMLAQLARPSTISSRAQWVSRPVFQQIALRQSVRRQTTEAAPIAGKPKKKRAGLFRWTWRLSKLAAIGGLGYVGYGIWEMRNPADQPPPDPSKKTLVVLGMHHLCRKCKPTLTDWHEQVPAGALSLCSRSSTPKTTM
jgi:NADH:ubiquinone reductase (non-electrogenic)